jgi:hypothetical protein
MRTLSYRYFGSTEPNFTMNPHVCGEKSDRYYL